jgi:hypothetical protein
MAMDPPQSGEHSRTGYTFPVRRFIEVENALTSLAPLAKLRSPDG